MSTMRKYILPFLFAIVLGLAGCGGGAANDDFEDSAAPGVIEEGEGVGD